MLIRLQPRRDEKAALAFDDVASGLDAGLPPALLGGDPGAGDRMLPGLFARRRIDLDRSEDLVLVAAWRAGRAPAALRHVSEQRRARALLARAVAGAMSYPALLIAVAILVSLVVGSRWLPLVVLGAIAGLALAVHRGLRRLEQGRSALLGLPVFGTWALDLAELPYLEVLGGLYGAGVPLLAAHPQAVAACPVAVVRSRLQAADRELQQGRTLTESLLHAAALHEETRHLLATGEKAGTLEDAMRRALERRRSVAAQGAARIGRLLAFSLYLLGLSVAGFVILRFYSGYFAALRGLGH